MSNGSLNDEILDYITRSEFDSLVCEPSFSEEDFNVHEDLSALAEFVF